MSDSLLPRIAAGDSEAVQQCIDRYSGLVWSLARRLCHSMADAEESVQEVFISIWENAGRFDESIASETTFIAMIARRRLIDRRRMKQRRPDHDSPLDATDYHPAEHDRAHTSVETSDEAARAVAALSQLRPEQREVLELSIMHGRKYEQIAETIGIPYGTVKTHARRGLMRLREILDAERAGEAKR